MKLPSTPTKPTPLAIYRYRPIRWSDVFTLIFPGILSVLTPLLYGVNRASYASTHFGPSAVGYWSRPWFTLAVIALLVFISLSLFRLVRAHQFVAVYKKGLQIKLERTLVLRWEEIAGVAFRTSQRHFLGIPLLTHNHAVLYPGNGRSIELPDGLQNLPELVTHIKAHLYPRIKPEMEASFQAGKWLYFGPVEIQQSAIKLNTGAYRKKSGIPWSLVERLRIQSGFLVVELKDGARRRLPVSQIPNLEILLELIQSGVSA